MSLRLNITVLVVVPLDRSLAALESALNAAGVRAMDRNGGIGSEDPDGGSRIRFDVIAEDPAATTEAILEGFEAQGLEVLGHALDVSIVEPQKLHIGGLDFDMGTGTLTVEAVKPPSAPLPPGVLARYSAADRPYEDVTITLPPGGDHIGLLASGVGWQRYREEVVRGLARVVVRRSTDTGAAGSVAAATRPAGDGAAAGGWRAPGVSFDAAQRTVAVETRGERFADLELELVRTPDGVSALVATHRDGYGRVEDSISGMTTILVRRGDAVS